MLGQDAGSTGLKLRMVVRKNTVTLSAMVKAAPNSQVAAAGLGTPPTHQPALPSFANARRMPRCSVSRPMQWLPSASTTRQAWRTTLTIALPHNTWRAATWARSTPGANCTAAGKACYQSLSRSSGPGSGK